MKKSIAVIIVIFLFVVLSCSKDESNELAGTKWRLIIAPADVYKVAFMQFTSKDMIYYYSYDSAFYHHSTVRYVVENDSIITTSQTPVGQLRGSYFYNVSVDTLTLSWDSGSSQYTKYDIDVSMLPEVID